jgi:hypothetical protein
MFSIPTRVLNVIKLTLMSLCVMTFLGCATQATISPGGDASSTQKISESHGSVAFRLTVSGVGINHFFTFWHQVEVQRIDGETRGEKFFVAMSDLGAMGSATYFGALPEGRYEITSFSSQQCGLMCIKSTLSLGTDTFRFDVEKGKITYLGGVIYQRVSETKSRLIASGSIDKDNFQTWLKTYYPAVASMPIREKSQNEDFVAKNNTYRSVQDSSAGFLNPVTLKNGDVLFNTLSGSIRQFSWPSGVKPLNTGVNSRANAVLPITDKYWLVGGDFGEIRFTMDAGASWQEVKLNLPYGAIRALYKGKNDEIMVFIQQKQKLNIYVGNLERNEWSLYSSKDFKFDVWKGGLTSPLIVPHTKSNRIMVALPSAPAFIIDTETYAITDFEFPGAVMNAGLSGDDVIRCRCNKSGLWVSTWESRDLGKTWKDSDLDRTLPLPQFKDKIIGLNAEKFDVQLTTDGGAKWEKVYQQDRQYWPFLFLPYTLSFVYIDDHRVIATDSLYEIIASEDTGKTWRRIPKVAREN